SGYTRILISPPIRGRPTRAAVPRLGDAAPPCALDLPVDGLLGALYNPRSPKTRGVGDSPRRCQSAGRRRGSPLSPANRRPGSWDIRDGQSSRPRFAVAPGAPRVELINVGTSAVEGGAQPASEYAIGIDVGGTKIAAGLVEFPTATVI